MHKGRRLVHLIPLAPAIGLAAPGDAAAAPAPSRALTPQVQSQPGQPRVAQVAPTTDVVLVTGLTVSAPLATAGQTVHVSATFRNVAKTTLASIEWRLVFGGETRTGTITSVAPGAAATVTQAFTASGAGEKEIVFTIDPASKVEGILKDRLNDEARTKLVVTTGSSTQWSVWSRKAAADVSRMIGAAKPSACVEGAITGTTLAVTKIDPGNGGAGVFLPTLTNDGIPSEIARPIAETLWDAYSKWLSSYQGSHPGAFPAFAAFPSPVAPPTPSVPVALAAFGGKPPPNAPELEQQLRARLGARASDPGASDAIKNLAVAIAVQLMTWYATQEVAVLGTGPVPSFAPPYVPVGPVVGGTVVRPPPPAACNHLR